MLIFLHSESSWKDQRKFLLEYRYVFKQKGDEMRELHQWEDVFWSNTKILEPKL